MITTHSEFYQLGTARGSAEEKAAQEHLNSLPKDMLDAYSLAGARDGAWFDVHRRRCHLLRRPLDGEAEVLWRVFHIPAMIVVVRQIKPGLRQRAGAIWSPGEPMPPNRESVAHALFDHVMAETADLAEGGLLSVLTLPELMAMAAPYATGRAT